MARQELLRSPFIFKAAILLLATILTVGLWVTEGLADWLIYHKPAFEGKVIDAETKEPIEGAAVVALYNKRTLGLGAGTLLSVVNIREALTDKEGKFRIPSYTTLIQPFSWEEDTTFLIYKPGYVNIDGMDLEGFFTGRESGIPDREFSWLYSQELVFRLKAPNIIELPKVRTRDERLRAIPGRSPEVRKKANKLRLIIEQERKILFLTKGD